MKASITKFDDDSYLMDFCPYCLANISYKYAKDKSGHTFIKETGYYDRTVYYLCKETDKQFYVTG